MTRAWLVVITVGFLACSGPAVPPESDASADATAPADGPLTPPDATAPADGPPDAPDATAPADGPPDAPDATAPADGLGATCSAMTCPGQHCFNAACFTPGQCTGAAECAVPVAGGTAACVGRKATLLARVGDELREQAPPDPLLAGRGRPRGAPAYSVMAFGGRGIVYSFLPALGVGRPAKTLPRRRGCRFPTGQTGSYATVRVPTGGQCSCAGANPGESGACRPGEVCMSNGYAFVCYPAWGL